MNDIDIQYRIIAAGAGWAERRRRGRLRFRGADRLAFLHALLTNEVRALQPGLGCYALYLTPQGRMIGDFHVFVRDDSVVADVPAELASGLARTFDSLVFSEDVQVADESEGLRQFEVAGPQAPQALGTAFDLEAAALRALPLWAQLDVPGGFVARTDEAGEGSWDVVVGSAAADRAVAALESAGAVRMSNELVEALRIDAGTPTFGVDMTSETIPLEAGLLDRAISQTKGCYPGQEVIVRVLHRGGGRVARRLVRVELGEGAAVPAAGDSVPVESGDTGRVTSAAWSPRLGRPVALAYVGRGV